ncbi:MAG: AAA family ATPase [Clostridia bacterium]|nr:AAA family ATPase [Clostridia bacterium]
MKTLYLIGGPMGVGKTTLSQHLKHDLPNSVFLDGDWCWDANPFLVNDETKSMVIDNICHLLNNFLRCSAYTNVIFCWVMHEDGIIFDILSRLDLHDVTVHKISLVATPEALTARLSGDIEKGLRSPDVIARSLARLPLYDRLSTRKIDTTDRSPEDIAREIQRL